MSGVAGADKIHRNKFKFVLNKFENIILKTWKPYCNLAISGSFNSQPNKMSFGDIDIIILCNGYTNKRDAKKAFIQHITTFPTNKISPFTSKRYSGKQYYNSGEIITVNFPYDNGEKTVQIDCIFSLNKQEQQYKQRFLNLPAEKQGLLLGIVKVAPIKQIDTLMSEIKSNQELEYNLSSVSLQLRKVTYEPGTYNTVKKEIIWSKNDWNDVTKLCNKFNFLKSFEDIVFTVEKIHTDMRSRRRIAGLFKSMITIKSGEIGKQKAVIKQKALNLIKETFE